MGKWRWYSKLLLALVLAAFAYFVWPTPYSWYPVERSRYMIQRNRVTGRCVFVEAQEPRQKRVAPDPFEEELRKQEGKDVTFGEVYGQEGTGQTIGDLYGQGGDGRSSDEGGDR